MIYHISIMSLGFFAIMVTLELAAPSSAQPSCTCKVEKKGMFKDCKNKNDALAWRSHFNTDVGLYGDCLPHVEENSMRCFRWRLADNCGPENAVKCSLRHRDNLYESSLANAQRKEAILTSPGFEKPRPGYYNKNFCLYNISLDCPDEMVDLTPTETTTGLNETQSCRDYLSFHVASRRTPLIDLCGAAVSDPSAYRTIQGSSFYAVLWSDNDGYDKGKFEIKATCKTQFPRQEGSGAGFE